MDGISNPVTVGYFGKVPTQGDFVSRGLPGSAVTAIDDWLGSSIRESQKTIGREWLDTFLVAPVWRMVLGPGVVGPDPIAGVMMPSVDRVGRYFPLIVAVNLSGMRPSLNELAVSSEFFDHIEALALSTLDPDFSLAQLDEKASSLGASTNYMSESNGDSGEGVAWWWTAKTQDEIFETQGLPPPEYFSELFLAHKTEQEECAEASNATPQKYEKSHTLIDVDCACAAMKGTRSMALTDAAVVNGDQQAVSIISGVGEHPWLADTIKRAANKLTEIENPFSMNDLMVDAKGKLGSVNALLAASSASASSELTASVATLLIQAQRYAILWAGNVRVYLYRDGILEQLTRDHTDTSFLDNVSCALGVNSNLFVDTAIGHIQPGDRLLLASPGLFKALGNYDIIKIISREITAQQAVTHLIQDALISGAMLDVSASVVMVSSRD